MLLRPDLTPQMPCELPLHIVLKVLNHCILECKRRIGLTGTALQNKYEELWCLLDWANPGCLGSCKHFQREFRLHTYLTYHIQIKIKNCDVSLSFDFKFIKH